MKTSRFLVFCLFLCGFGCHGGGVENLPSSDSATPKHILFITADGFRTDYVEWYNPPHIKKLIAEGVRVTHVKNVFPTVTTPNMTSIVTGSYPRTTGIACNTQYVKEEDRIVSGPRNNQAETIAETLQKAGWKTAVVNHFMLQNRGASFYKEAGYDDTEKTTAAVLEFLQQKDIRFVAVIYGATDHQGHQHGPHSDEVKNAVMAIDRGVGQLVDELKKQGTYDQTLITFNADHGMSGYEEKQASIEPALALQQAGFRVATSQKELKEDTQIIVLSWGVRLVYFRKELSNEAMAKARKALDSIQGVEILDRKALDALGCHDNRSGDLIVSPLPGYTMSGAGKKGGQHGRFAEQNPILFFHGSGFIQGTVDKVQTIDIVPTLLHLVNITPAATVDGKFITEALQK